MRHTTQAIADEDLDIASLETLYLLRDRVAVITFLQENVFLIDLVTLAARKIREYFGADARLALEVFTDPDDPSSGELFVKIRTGLKPSVARMKLDRFDEGWWLEASLHSDCKMNIALQCQS